MSCAPVTPPAMTEAIDPVELLKALIACPSVTPEEGGAQCLLGERQSQSDKGGALTVYFDITRFM